MGQGVAIVIVVGECFGFGAVWRELVIKVKSCLLSMFSFFPFSIWPMQVSLKESLAVRAQLSWHSNN